MHDPLLRYDVDPSALKFGATSQRPTSARTSKTFAFRLTLSSSFTRLTLYAEYVALRCYVFVVDHTLIFCSMGLTKDRAQEMMYFDGLLDEPENKRTLKEALKHKIENGHMQRTGWCKRMIAHCTTGYLARFSGCFAAESDLEFAYRKVKHPRANSTPFEAETEEERDRRLEHAPKVSRRSLRHGTQR